MIHVEAVSRPLTIPVPGKRPVEAVAKPVDRKKRDRCEQHPAIPASKVVRKSRERHSRETQQRQMIGIDPSRHSRCQPRQNSLLEGGNDAVLLPVGRFKRN